MNCRCAAAKCCSGDQESRNLRAGQEAVPSQALELDPNFAQGLCGSRLSPTCSITRTAGATIPMPRWARQGVRRARHRERSEGALAHAVAAVAATFSRNLERAQSEIDTALSLNPNLAMAYNIKGGIRIYLGRPEEAIPLIERAMRLDPATNQQFLHFLGMANLLAGRYETAAARCASAFGLCPTRIFPVRCLRPLSVILAKSRKPAACGRNS